MRLQNLFEEFGRKVKQFRNEPVPAHGILEVFTADVVYHGIVDILLSDGVSEILAATDSTSDIPDADFAVFMTDEGEHWCRKFIQYWSAAKHLFKEHHFDDDEVQDVLDDLKEKLSNLAKEFTLFCVDVVH